MKHKHEYVLTEVEKHTDCITERDPMTLKAYRTVGITYVSIKLKCADCGKVKHVKFRCGDVDG